MDRGRSSAAFTLLELGVVILIVAIVVVLALPGYQFFRGRAQRAQCTANLRSLAVAANLYLQEHGHWPQIPASASGANPEFARQWVDALRPFGIPEKSWICPTTQNLMGNPDYMAAETQRIDYMPMPFDDKPTTPRMWPTQPWFIEVGNVHGNGNLLILTDGSVTDLKTIASQAQPISSPSPTP